MIYYYYYYYYGIISYDTGTVHMICYDTVSYGMDIITAVYDTLYQRTRLMRIPVPGTVQGSTSVHTVSSVFGWDKKC